MPSDRPSFSVVTPRRGFSLVLSLSVMAMLLLLCVGGAALLAVELRAGRASASYSRARLNALAGARIALGELQRLVGPDQRVTATADILCNPDSKEADPTQASYYKSVSGTVVHPRWVGVWNSGRVKGADVSSVAQGEEGKVVQRTQEGYLMDSRFASGSDWAKDRNAQGSPRLLGWLVSGNEAMAGSDRDALSPTKPVRPATTPDSLGRAEDVELLSAGTLGALPSPAGKSDGDYLGARAAKVGLPGADSLSDSYAYWVSDEGVKARVNLTDKFEVAGKQPDAANLGDGGMFRLLLPQRNCFAAVKGAADKSGSIPWGDVETLAKKGRLAGVDSIESLAVVLAETDRSLRPSDLRGAYFHDITFDSAGIACDVVNGGLKKDLTAFLNDGGQAIADFGGIAGSGAKPSDPIIPGEGFAKISPKLGLIHNWCSALPSPTSDVLTAIAPDSTIKNYNLNQVVYASPRLQPSESFSLGIPRYANTTGTATMAPVLTRFDVYFATALNPGSQSGKSNARTMVYPRIDLWNPYSVPIVMEDVRVHWLTPMSMAVNLVNDADPRQVSSAVFDSRRPRRVFMLSTVKLEPGQTISYVPSSSGSGGTDVSNVPLSGGSVQIPMVPGAKPTYYLDGAWTRADAATDDVSATASALFNSMRYSWAFCVRQDGESVMMPPVSDSSSYDEGTGGGPLNQVFLTSGASKTFRQVDLAPWANYQFYAPQNSQAKGWTPSAFYATQLIGTVNEVAVTGPSASVHTGFRLLALDDSLAVIGGSVGERRNVNSNPFVNGNLLATRFTRHPFDTVKMSRVNGSYSFSPLTTDAMIAYDDPRVAPANATAVSPLLSFSTTGSATRYALLDVPRPSLGLLSLGQLQNAPLLQMPWAGGFSFGNAFMPLQADEFPKLTGRSGYSLEEENQIWGKVCPWSQFNHYIRQFSGGSVSWNNDAVLDKQHLLGDWSYELNHAMWDAWMTSGIPAKNKGWIDDQVGWDFSVQADGLVPDSRLVSAGSSKVTSDYRSSPNYRLYKVAGTTLRQGAFNVNSTSVAAWHSLLSAFRGIRVPVNTSGSISMDGDASRNPYSRFTIPITKAVSSGSGVADKETWGGYRSLGDDELRTLAEKIVVQVKKRGPFLSLADFVNRRLVGDSGAYGTLSSDENNFLGTLQAAINEAKLNEALSPTSGNVFLDRSKDSDLTNSGNNPEFATAAKIDPASKAKDKLAGVPGYLIQGDLLQKLGPVLTARSDTFKIRARGETEDGAVAFVELTVQRTPEPLVPGDASSGTLPVNPRSVPRTGSPECVGNQFLGRRMAVIRMRWLASEEI